MMMRRIWLMLWLLILPVHAAEYRAGFERPLPLLQTHVRPTLEPDHLWWGMQQETLSRYADQNQWSVQPPVQAERMVHTLDGGGLYTPEDQLVFTQDAKVHSYFRRGRLVGLLVIPTNRSLDPLTLTQWSRAWFPDEAVTIQYQSDFFDQGQQVLQAILGEIPPAFSNDVLKLLSPFRQIQLGNRFGN